MLVTISIVVLLFLIFLLIIVFGFFIYKDWHHSKNAYKIDHKLVSENNLEEYLHSNLNYRINKKNKNN